jgi:hypothetical protein
MFARFPSRYRLRHCRICAACGNNEITVSAVTTICGKSKGLAILHAVEAPIAQAALSLAVVGKIFGGQNLRRRQGYSLRRDF